MEQLESRGSAEGQEGVGALPPLMTITEVARALRVHEKTIRRWVAARRLPCVRLGTRVRFDSRDVLRWVRQRKEG